MGFWSHLLFHDWFRSPSQGDTRMSPLPMRQARYERVYLDPPFPPDFHVKDFGMLNYPKCVFIDRHDKAGIYNPYTRMLIDSEGETMTLWDFMALPNRQRRTSYIKIGEGVV